MIAAAQPHLIAIGGLSGSGKSTLARALADERGALLLRSDVERKNHFGVAEIFRLGPEAYTHDITALIYQRLCDMCSATLDDTIDVIVDAVFQRPAERRAIEAVAVVRNVPFVGLWLDADVTLRRARVASRAGDASDATAAIVDLQAQRETGSILWHRVDAGRTAQEALDAARAILRSHA